MRFTIRKNKSQFRFIAHQNEVNNDDNNDRDVFRSNKKDERTTEYPPTNSSVTKPS